jgi:hypothetical protein
MKPLNKILQSGRPPGKMQPVATRRVVSFLGKRDLFASLATPNLFDQREWPTRLVEVSLAN